MWSWNDGMPKDTRWYWSVVSTPLAMASFSTSSASGVASAVAASSQNSTLSPRSCMCLANVSISAGRSMLASRSL